MCIYSFILVFNLMMAFYPKLVVESNVINGSVLTGFIVILIVKKHNGDELS